MNKFQSATIAALVVVAPVIGLQFLRISGLKKEVESLRSEFVSSAKIQRSRFGDDSGERGSKDSGKPSHNVGFSEIALRNILSQADPSSRIRSLLEYIDTLSGDEIPAALEALRKGTPEWDPEAKMLAHILLTRWAQEDPNAAYASLATLDPKKQGQDATSILAALASMDPQRAAAWVNDPGNALARFPWMGQLLAGTVAKEWVRLDPDAALAWASGLPKNQRAGAYSGVLGTLASSDPERASLIAMNLEADGARTHIVGEIAKSWSRTSSEAALEWATSLEGADRRSAMNHALESWAESNPSAVAGYLDEMAGDENIDPFVSRVATSWASQAPDEAAAWLAAQPEGEGKAEAMGRVAWTWTTSDPVAASTWLSDQPEGPSRDSAIEGLAKAAFDGDPEGAVSWAFQMSDEGRRNAAVDRGLTEWNRREPQEAASWAEQNGVKIPEEMEK